MTPERKAKLEAAAEYGRRMADETIAKMQREIDRRDEHIALLRDSEAWLARTEAEALARRRPRLVAIEGARVDQRSPWDFG